jgi:hypothetical protein
MASLTFALVVLPRDVQAEAEEQRELQVIGALGYGFAHTHGAAGTLASGRLSLRGLGWLSDQFGLGLEGGSFSNSYNGPTTNIACGAPPFRMCADTGSRDGGWIAPLAMLSARLGIVRPYAGVSLGVAWVSRSGEIAGRRSWLSPAVALLGGVNVDLWRFTVALDMRGDAIDDVIDATAELGVGVNLY